MITTIKQFKKLNEGSQSWKEWYDSTIAPAKGDITMYIHKIKKKVNEIDAEMVAKQYYYGDIMRIKNQLAEVVGEEVPVMEKVEPKSSLIDMKKLTNVADGIFKLCFDYGNVYFNDETNYIAVVLGDSNPFSSDALEEDIKYGVAKDYKDGDKIKVEVDCEWVPKDCKYKYTDKGWVKINNGQE